MKKDAPAGETGHRRSSNGKKKEDRKKRQSVGGGKGSGSASGLTGGDAGSRGGGGGASAGVPTPTQAEVDALKGRLLAGMNTIVLLQDGTQLACLLLYNPAEQCLSISCEDKVRIIPLSDVKALLYTRDQLQRVETKANLVGDQCCVALHLQESGNCIPLRFDSPADKSAFVELVKRVKTGGT